MAHDMMHAAPPKKAILLSLILPNHPGSNF
jgi:hypothetical protein